MIGNLKPQIAVLFFLNPRYRSHRSPPERCLIVRQQSAPADPAPCSGTRGADTAILFDPGVFISPPDNDLTCSPKLMNVKIHDPRRLFAMLTIPWVCKFAVWDSGLRMRTLSTGASAPVSIQEIEPGDKRDLRLLPTFQSDIHLSMTSEIAVQGQHSADLCSRNV